MAIPRSDDAPGGERSLRVGRVAAPLRSQALVVLRQAILDFHYKPGQRLIERELMEDLGVSRTTIREVLRELGSEGLVTSIPQRGLIVASPSLKEATEVYEVRRALEELAMRAFIEKASNEQVSRLRAALTAFENETGEGGDFRALLRSKDDAYQVVLEGGDNDAVRTITEGLRARVRALDAASLGVPGRSAAELGELRLIVQAAERRDADAAAAAVHAHVAAASAAGLAALQAVDASGA
jgi:DNA-binding GntR family transcriptional regulator